MINLKSLLNETFLGGGELPSSKLIKMKQTMAETMADDNDESVVAEGNQPHKEIKKAIKGMKGVSMDIKGDTIIVSNKSGDEFIYSMNDADDVADFITTIKKAAAEPEVITQLRKIVKDKQNALVVDTKSNKKVRVDMQSASLMVQVYDALKQQSNKDKFVKSGIVAMGHMAYKLMKNESVNESSSFKEQPTRHKV